MSNRLSKRKLIIDARVKQAAKNVEKSVEKLKRAKIPKSKASGKVEQKVKAFNEKAKKAAVASTNKNVPPSIKQELIKNAIALGKMLISVMPLGLLMGMGVLNTTNRARNRQTIERMSRNTSTLQRHRAEARLANEREALLQQRNQLMQNGLVGRFANQEDIEYALEVEHRRRERELQRQQQNAAAGVITNSVQEAVNNLRELGNQVIAEAREEQNNRSRFSGLDIDPENRKTNNTENTRFSGLEIDPPSSSNNKNNKNNVQTNALKNEVKTIINKAQNNNSKINNSKQRKARNFNLSNIAIYQHGEYMPMGMSPKIFAQQNAKMNKLKLKREIRNISKENQLGAKKDKKPKISIYEKMPWCTKFTDDEKVSIAKNVEKDVKKLEKEKLKGKTKKAQKINNQIDKISNASKRIAKQAKEGNNKKNIVLLRSLIVEALTTATMMIPLVLVVGFPDIANFINNRRVRREINRRREQAMRSGLGDISSEHWQEPTQEQIAENARQYEIENAQKRRMITLLKSLIGNLKALFNRTKEQNSNQTTIETSAAAPTTTPTITTPIGTPTETNRFSGIDL